MIAWEKNGFKLSINKKWVVGTYKLPSKTDQQNVVVWQDLLDLRASWKWQQSLFQVTLHENGSLYGQWPRTWAGAGGEPSDAQERLALFQDIFLFRMQQSLTADSLI